jgi:hypothetical protein
MQPQDNRTVSAEWGPNISVDRRRTLPVFDAVFEPSSIRKYGGGAVLYDRDRRKTAIFAAEDTRSETDTTVPLYRNKREHITGERRSCLG